MAEASHEMTHDDHGHHSNTVALLGREITVEGGHIHRRLWRLGDPDRHRSCQRRIP